MARDNGDRNWCFTINNYSEVEVAALDALNVTYLCYGREVGESGTPHLQGYVVFPNKKTITAVKKTFGFGRAHLETKRGTHEQAAEYTKKDKDFTERGTLPMDPKRKGECAQEHYRNLRLCAEEGRFEEIDEKVRFNQIRLIEHHHKRAQRSRILEDATTLNLWYWGSSGTGKSRKAREDHP